MDNMKKTYQKPQTDTTKVQPHLMAQLSTTEGPASKEGEVLSRRRGSNWEDDEEDY